ncbi:Phosphotransferase IIA-like nitrogen-regulatory protein PtsN OS=Eoetvoesiella caeni OX=645616 GN=DFR37_107149 PE=4 SV=1 [Eoetvoesiella caeni]|uniref:Phosphotransferase IIA-like nitrogen-regulatory protein PtsN n=2 Tax=Eoetvoesiella caeni TaxID=645616 RepID=A0A366HA06_9BURK|nr:phosphotransferase IIA-like nitrogen-regulatory protein PtsN [Eoetvoesiella caeni]
MHSMNLMSRILPLQNIVLDLAATSKKRAFEQAGLLFENHHGVARTSVFQSLIARERLGSTALGHHIAVPHGRIKGLKEPCAAFIRLADPVRFDPSDGRLASLLFFLLVPETATQLHLDLLAEIAKLVSNPALRQALATETDVVAIHRLLTTDADE